jgi:CheY-like chemotaxis protein
MARQEKPAHPRILLVDDQPDLRLSLRFMLEHDEFLVSEASNGAQALERLAREKIDVILTDLYMPDIDGISLVRALGSLPTRPPIIAMSGWYAGHKDALEAARTLGSDALLEKPFTRQDLVRTIRSLIAHRSPLVKHP